MVFDAAVFSNGFLIAFALISAIGAQNAFILKQGIIGNRPFLIATLATTIDCGMITLGVLGMGKLISTHPNYLMLVKWIGIIFLICYGLLSIRNAFTGKSMKISSGTYTHSLKWTVTTLFALSFLNPHMYLDTMVLLGSIGSQFPTELRPSFLAGAIFSSAIWFFGLSFGSKLLYPIFKKPQAWAALDVFIAIIMFMIAASLYLS